MRIKVEVRKRMMQSGYNPDLMIMTLLQIEHHIPLPLNQDHLMWLSQEKLIGRNKNGELILTFALYEDQLEPEINQSKVLHDEVEARVNEYRHLFKGIRTSSMADKKVVIEYLKRFIGEEDVKFDDIVRVTTLAIQTADLKYFPNADNFIYAVRGNKEISQLRTAFEEHDTVEINSNFI